MKRNISKAIAEGTKIRYQRERLDLCITDVLAIWDQYKGKGTESIINALTAAYSAGLAVGTRNGRNNPPAK